MSLGIPYARVEFDGGRQVRVCPVCGARVAENPARQGESYATHYAENHDDDDES